MNGAVRDPVLLRVEKGSPNEEELAALTAVLIARAGAGDATAGDGCRTEWSGPSWHRPERMTVFVNPRAWR
ncbi:acyl-CoA carboxylase subunit epsilon [Streptomyces sp. NPDC002067]